MPFKKGQSGNPAGKPPGTKSIGIGQTHNWLRDKCRELLEKDKGKLIDFLYDVASGAEIDIHVTQFGKKVKVPASIKERRGAVKDLADRGYGQPAQEVKVEDKRAPRRIIVRYTEEPDKKPDGDPRD